MKLQTALRMLPDQMHDRFKFDVGWWRLYYRAYNASPENQYAPEAGWPEEWAVEMTFRNMRGEDVQFQGPHFEKHWCRGYYYCLRCYGD